MLDQTATSTDSPPNARDQTPGRSGAAMMRWWVYQKERFPLAAYIPLIGAFSFCAVSLSWMLRGQTGLPPTGALIVAFIGCLLFFLQLRIADEFKDFAEDARYRPYRPVPRGLVTLRELGVLFAIAALIQAAAVLFLAPVLILGLLVVWVYLALMTKEFFVRSWLEARPLIYLVTHMAIMPLVDLFATSTDWLIVQTGPATGLAWFLAASFFNGMSLDIGRKIRSPMDEEQGVNTYSHVWGRTRAIAAWLVFLLLTFGCALFVADQIDFFWPVAASLGVCLLMCALAGIWFLRHPKKGRGKVIELLGSLWTLLLYLILGAAPLIYRSLS